MTYGGTSDASHRHPRGGRSARHEAPPAGQPAGDPGWDRGDRARAWPEPTAPASEATDEWPPAVPTHQWPPAPPSDEWSPAPPSDEWRPAPPSDEWSPGIAPGRSRDRETGPAREAAHAPRRDTAHAPRWDTAHAPRRDTAHAPRWDTAHAPRRDTAPGWPDEAEPARPGGNPPAGVDDSPPGWPGTTPAWAPAGRTRSDARTDSGGWGGPDRRTGPAGRGGRSALDTAPRPDARPDLRRPQPGRSGGGWRTYLLVSVLVLLVVPGIGFGVLKSGLLDRAPAPRAAPLPATGSVAPTPSAAPSPSSIAAAPVDKGTGTFAALAAGGPVLGTAGGLRRFHVEVENGINENPDEFAKTIDQVLGDPRSWIAGGQFRLQRVPRAAPADFTIYLASPATSETMCAVGGLHTDKYTSCRLTGQVIINDARWLTAVPDYNAPLDVYRAYAINHEVGHELGHGHEACTGPGQPAPVMEQQTLGLKGCVANPWPFLNGQRYAGPAIP